MLQDFALRVLRGVGSLLMIPVRGASVLLARIFYPLSIVGFFGSLGIAAVQATQGTWLVVIMAVFTALFSAGLYVGARAVLRAWYAPGDRPRVQVRYVYRDSIY